jgi:hypothetical protein
MSIDSKVQQALEQVTVSLGGAVTGTKEGHIEQVEKQIAGGDIRVSSAIGASSVKAVELVSVSLGGVFSPETKDNLKRDPPKEPHPRQSPSNAQHNDNNSTHAPTKTDDQAQRDQKPDTQPDKEKAWSRNMTTNPASTDTNHTN